MTAPGSMSPDQPQPFASGSDDDIAAPSCLSEELENYLYVQGFAGESVLDSLVVPPANPLDPPGNTLDTLIHYWLRMDRRRYSALPFFVRQEKVQAAFDRDLKALEQNLLPKSYTRQTLEDIRALFLLMDAYDRISGIQNRVRRVLKQEVTRQLQGY